MDDRQIKLMLEKYKCVLGDTILMYQLIENDLKIIYAGIYSGDFDENLRLVRFDDRFKGLGKVIKELQNLDQMRGRKTLSDSDYFVLKELAKNRNYFCHQCGIDFLYCKQENIETEMTKAFEKLNKAHKELFMLHKTLERFRLKVLDKYGRI